MSGGVTMSNVLLRKRSVSDREFYMNGSRIRVEVVKLMASDKVVPKSYRLMCAVPTVETAKSLVDNIVRAEAFYPNTAHSVIYRKHYLTLAIADCYRLVQDMQTLKDIGLPINLNRFKDLADMIDREIALLKGTRKSVRLTGDAPVSERIARARVEIEELEELLEDGDLG